MKIAYAWWVFLGSLLIAIPLRICQIAFLVDHRGFFLDHGVTAIILTLFVLCSAATIITMCHLDKHSPKRYTPVKNIPAGAMAILAAIAVIVHSILQIVYSGGSDGSDLSEISAELASQFSSGQEYLSILLGFLGIVAGIVWLIQAAGHFLGRNLFAAHRYSRCSRRFGFAVRWCHPSSITPRTSICRKISAICWLSCSCCCSCLPRPSWPPSSRLSAAARACMRLVFPPCCLWELQPCRTCFSRWKDGSLPAHWA